MFNSKSFAHLILIGGICVLLLSVSCNITKDKSDNSNAAKSKLSSSVEVGNVKVQDVDYEDFKGMTVVERWRSFTPERRNYLRQNPELYAYYKPFIAAEPNIEPEGTIQYSGVQHKVDSESPGQPKTAEEWWNSFSEERKAYMRQNPQYYPEFEQFFND